MEEADNSMCATSPPEMMQFLLWTTGSVFGFVYILLGKLLINHLKNTTVLPHIISNGLA